MPTIMSRSKVALLKSSETDGRSPRFLKEIWQFLSKLPLGITFHTNSGGSNNQNSLGSSPVTRFGMPMGFNGMPVGANGIPNGASSAFGGNAMPFGSLGSMGFPMRQMNPMFFHNANYPFGLPFNSMHPLTFQNSWQNLLAKKTGTFMPQMHDFSQPFSHNLHDNRRPNLFDNGHKGQHEFTFRCYSLDCDSLAITCRTLPRENQKIGKVKIQYQRQFATSANSNACGQFEVCCKAQTMQSAPVGVPLGGAFSKVGVCGVSNIDGINSRINAPFVAEGETAFGEFPWQAAVLKKEGIDNVYICAGSLIDNRNIVTAAHCIQGYQASDLRLRLGEWDVNRDTEFYPYYESNVSGVFVHPEFYPGNLINDVAVIRIMTPVDFLKSPHIAPACLPPAGLDFTGQRCWVTGWGKDGFGDGGSYQNVLKKVDVQVVSTPFCQTQLRQTRLGSAYSLHPGMVCAGGELGKDACKGDGGGPLVCATTKDVYLLAGVVSWGIGCGTAGVPGVYVNVPFYLEWIRQIQNF